MHQTPEKCMAEGNPYPGSWTKNGRKGVLVACLRYDLKGLLVNSS